MSLPAPYPAPLDSPHFLPSFRVSTCDFASKTFARAKKTPALQAIKWSITKQGVKEHNLCYLWIDERRPLHNIIASNTPHYIFALVVKSIREVRCLRVWSIFFLLFVRVWDVRSGRSIHKLKGHKVVNYYFFSNFRGYSIILPFLMKRNFVQVW